MFLHVSNALYIDGYKVALLFNDGRKGIADLSSALEGPAFEALKELSVFSQLRLDQELDTVVWPNGADFAPEYLYYQAFKSLPELQSQFRIWGYVA